MNLVLLATVLVSLQHVPTAINNTSSRKVKGYMSLSIDTHKIERTVSASEDAR